MSDNEFRSIQANILALSVAGGMLLERQTALPDEKAACGFDALHSTLADLLLGEDDPVLRSLLVGMVAAGCLVDQNILVPPQPPTPDGAFDIFSDWAHAEGRSFSDLRRVFRLGAMCAAQGVEVFGEAIRQMRSAAQEEDS